MTCTQRLYYYTAGVLVERCGKQWLRYDHTHFRYSGMNLLAAHSVNMAFLVLYGDYVDTENMMFLYVQAEDADVWVHNGIGNPRHVALRGRMSAPSFQKLCKCLQDHLEEAEESTCSPCPLKWKFCENKWLKGVGWVVGIFTLGISCLCCGLCSQKRSREVLLENVRRFNILSDVSGVYLSLHNLKDAVQTRLEFTIDDSQIAQIEV